MLSLNGIAFEPPLDVNPVVRTPRSAQLNKAGHRSRSPSPEPKARAAHPNYSACKGDSGEQSFGNLAALVSSLGPCSPHSEGRECAPCPCCQNRMEDSALPSHNLDALPSDTELWNSIREEAQRDVAAEPDLASFLWSTILSHRNLYEALCFRLAHKLANPTLLSTQLVTMISEVFNRDCCVRQAIRADLVAVKQRDPACRGYSQPLLHFKGFQAVQAYRVAHSMWAQGRKAIAHTLQSLISDVFHVDIHPAARIGKRLHASFFFAPLLLLRLYATDPLRSAPQGILVDHAIGVVIGETAVVGDDVSILHNVTLGGNGKETGDRHPKIGHGVLLGAHVTVLGNIRIGIFAKIGAGSVVLNDVPAHRTAVGVPAKVLGGPSNKDPCPSLCMDHRVGTLSAAGDYVLDFQI
eukprot:tig00000658_g2923.t1